MFKQINRASEMRVQTNNNKLRTGGAVLPPIKRKPSHLRLFSTDPRKERSVSPSPDLHLP